MRTIQMTLDDDLVKAVDRVSAEMNTSRSSFTRKALRAALAAHKRKQLEEEHRRGYENHPVCAEEFGVWETEQSWGKE